MRQRLTKLLLPLLLHLNFPVIIKSIFWHDACTTEVLENTATDLSREDWSDIVYTLACEHHYEGPNFNNNCKNLIDNEHTIWDTLPEDVQEEFCDEACDLTSSSFCNNSSSNSKCKNIDMTDRIKLGGVSSEEAQGIANDLCDNAANHWNEIVSELITIYDKVNNGTEVTTVYEYECRDVSNWSDIFNDDCADYEEQDWCSEYQDCCANNIIDDNNNDDDHEALMYTSGTACCVCGGGILYENTSMLPSEYPSEAPSQSIITPTTLNLNADHTRSVVVEFDFPFGVMIAGADVSAATLLFVDATSASNNNDNDNNGGISLGDAILHYLYGLVSAYIEEEEEEASLLQLVEIRYIGVRILEEEECAASAAVTCANLIARITLHAVHITPTYSADVDDVMDDVNVSNTIVAALREGQTEGMYFEGHVEGLTAMTIGGGYDNNAANSIDKTASAAFRCGAITSSSVGSLCLLLVTTLVVYYAAV